MKTRTFLITVTLIGMGSIVLYRCKENDSVTPLGGTPVTGQASIDTSWTMDKVHCNVGWESRYFDYSSTMLTGRFNMFGLGSIGKRGKFVFNEADLSKCMLESWVQLSTFNTGEPGRDGLGKCGLGYLGIVYLDSLKTKVDPKSDTAWFKSTSFIRSGTGYIVKGNFTFNRYRSPSGYADGTPITKPVNMYLAYNGMQDFDSNNDGKTDKYRAGFTGTFTFNRADFMDNTSTKAYYPVPTYSDSVANVTAAKNKTYGVWSKSIADEMSITVNLQMYKNHQ